MSNILLIILAAAFAGLLYACRLQQQKHQLLQALQENFNRARCELSQHEAQSGELNYEITQLRIQASSLKVQLNKFSQYQHVVDIEQYVLTRRLQADSFIEMTKLNAEIMLDDVKRMIAQVREFLAQHQQQVQDSVERKAQEKLQDYYAHAQALQERRDIVQALERKIRGDQQQYFFPHPRLLEQLIDGYSEADAARHLQAVRSRIQAANASGQVAECHYVDESRCLAFSALVTLAFNSKADLYLAQLDGANLGQLLQALQDDYQLINFHGNHFSHSHIHESYLNLRLEELKFAALLQAAKAHSVQEQAEKLLN